MNKNFYRSKTMWAALIITIISNAFPDAKELIKAHPDFIMSAVTFVFMVLRLQTSTGIK